jgi:hypothetical protein
MLSSAVTQGVAVATGIQHNFDWAGVAAAGIGAGAGSAVESSSSATVAHGADNLGVVAPVAVIPLYQN